MTMALSPDCVMYAGGLPDDGTENAVQTIPPPPLEMPPNLAALALTVEHDAAEAARLVAGIREEGILTAAFDRVRMSDPHPLVDRIAVGGLHAAYVRMGYCVASRQPSSIARQVPATICESPDLLSAEFGLDQSLTEQLHADVMQLRRSAYDDTPTGAVPVLVTKLMPRLSEYATDDRTSVARRAISRLIDAAHRTKAGPADYYAQALVEREDAMRMVAAVENGVLPGHTPSEVRLLLAELGNMVDDPLLDPTEKVEVIAVRTLVASGHIPRIINIPTLVRQRGARQAIDRILTRFELGASRWMGRVARANGLNS